MLSHPKPALTALGSLDNVRGSAARCRLEQTKQAPRKKHRMSPEQLRLMSRRIDPTQPLPSPHTGPVKPALPVLYSPSLPASKKRKRAGIHYITPNQGLPSESLMYTPPTSPQPLASNTNTNSNDNNSSSSSSSSSSKLFQTCFNIWPGAPSLGDLTHENVKCLSELLKVRLSQAKYRLMAALEADKTDPLYLQLKSGEDEQGWPLMMRKPQKIQLPTKRHHAFAVTVGSGRRLFKNMAPSRSSATTTTPIAATQHIKLVTDDYGKLSVVAVTVSAQERKRSTKKRKVPASAAGVSVSGRGVTQRQQASSPFCCKPCNKRYKNRSGLAYHLDRCKFQTPPGKENIQCICGHVSQKDQTLVCCRACQSWLHRPCVGLEDNAKVEDYTCPRCPASHSPSLSPQTSTEQQQNPSSPTEGNDQQQLLLWSTPMLEGYGSPWSMPDIPSMLFSDPLSMPDEDYGLMTPTSNASLSGTPLPQQDSCWFEFADFDNDFTCD